jgi:hypothetical protein
VCKRACISFGICLAFCFGSSGFIPVSGSGKLKHITRQVHTSPGSSVLSRRRGELAHSHRKAIIGSIRVARRAGM